MFHPTSNRLSFFLEISALSVQLAQAGGWQAKAGMLTVEAALKRVMDLAERTPIGHLGRNSGGVLYEKVTWLPSKNLRR